METPQKLPKISIVVPSYNRGPYIGETLQSLVDQEYPNLEVVIQDAFSFDDSIAIAREFVARHPDTFQLFVEKDRGAAHRLNLGLSKTTGEIIGLLNDENTLYPGCLRRVAQEVDPGSNRYIVMGRCIFIGQGMPHRGVEHPCEYIDHFHHLAIWLRGANTIPRPSVFSHRSVWEKCGGFDESQPDFLDYELFCRFTRQFHIHRVDKVWSTYRIHLDSEIFSRSETEVMAMSIATSRKYWGGWSSILRWRCEISLFLHNPMRFEKARPHARAAEEAFQRGSLVRGLFETTFAMARSPRLALRRLIIPFVAHRFFSPILRLLMRSKMDLSSGQPRFADGWTGPNFVERISIPAQARQLCLQVEYYRPKPMKTRITVLLDGQTRYSSIVDSAIILEIALGIEDLAGADVNLQITSSTYFIPKLEADLDDLRKLSLRIIDIQFQKGESLSCDMAKR